MCCLIIGLKKGHGGVHDILFVGLQKGHGGVHDILFVGLQKGHESLQFVGWNKAMNIWSLAMTYSERVMRELEIDARSGENATSIIGAVRMTRGVHGDELADDVEQTR